MKARSVRPLTVKVALCVPLPTLPLYLPAVAFDALPPLATVLLTPAEETVCAPTVSDARSFWAPFGSLTVTSEVPLAIVSVPTFDHAPPAKRSTLTAVKFGRPSPLTVAMNGYPA